MSTSWLHDKIMIMGGGSILPHGAQQLVHPKDLINFFNTKNLMRVLFVIVTALVLSSLLLLLFNRIITPQLDPREPPLIYPRIPLIGHMIDLVRNGSDFIVGTRRRRSSGVTTSLPKDKEERPDRQAIGTLPMLNGYSYVIWSPHLIQQAIRQRNLTFDRQGFHFSGPVFGVSKESLDLLRGEDGDEDNWPGMKTLAAMRPAMLGDNLTDMNQRALRSIALHVNKIARDGTETVVDNVLIWLRDLITLASTEALYGHQNPLRNKPELSEHLWQFDTHLRPLFLGSLARFFARTARTNREIVQAAFMKYYGERMDEAEDVAKITKVRAGFSRDVGMNNEDLTRLECALLFVATTNTVPTLFWFFMNIYMRPELVEELRAEVAPLVQVLDDVEKPRKTRRAIIDTALFESSCPLLVSAYRECIRLANQSISNRYVTEDTILTDDDGRQYLLKKDHLVIWTVKGLHRSTDAWGPDADSFVAERFLPNPAMSAADEKLRKNSYIPFGGGKHLCPGRYFAVTESLALLAVLVVGFDVAGLDTSKYRMGTAKFNDTVVKPDVGFEGGSVTLKRRNGFEDVEWDFKC